MQVESVANVLPAVMANSLACMYGESYPLESECNESKQDTPLLCSMAKLSQRSCHLQKYNRYKFSITVVLTEGGDVLQLLAGHSFQVTNSVMKL